VSVSGRHKFGMILVSIPIWNGENRIFSLTMVCMVCMRMYIYVFMKATSFKECMAVVVYSVCPKIRDLRRLRRCCWRIHRRALETVPLPQSFPEDFQFPYIKN
jgi:hypothetical protein